MLWFTTLILLSLWNLLLLSTFIITPVSGSNDAPVQTVIQCDLERTEPVWLEWDESEVMYKYAPNQNDDNNNNNNNPALLINDDNEIANTTSINNNNNNMTIISSSSSPPRFVMGRTCWCGRYLGRVREVCPIQYDTCVVNGEIGPIHCYNNIRGINIIRGFWPVCLFWYAALFYIFLTSEQGQAARRFIYHQIICKYCCFCCCCNNNYHQTIHDDLEQLLVRQPDRAAWLYRSARNRHFVQQRRLVIQEERRQARRRRRGGGGGGENEEEEENNNMENESSPDTTTVNDTETRNNDTENNNNDNNHGSVNDDDSSSSQSQADHAPTTEDQNTASSFAMHAQPKLTLKTKRFQSIDLQTLPIESNSNKNKNLNSAISNNNNNNTTSNNDTNSDTSLEKSTSVVHQQTIDVEAPPPQVDNNVNDDTMKKDKPTKIDTSKKNNHHNFMDDYNDLDLENNGSHCAICLVEFQNGDIVGDIPCGHLFHKDCLKVWLQRRNKCPLCQQSNIATLSFGD